MRNRVPTGIPEFDMLIEGGFLQGSLILLAGGPGAGKTIFSAKFIYEGATKYGEPGVYACFAENKKMLISELQEFGLDFEPLIKKRHVEILDLSIAMEIEVQSALNKILEAIMYINAKRLVIDSITALFAGLKSYLEKRHLIHLLYRLVQKSGCTTIVITDIPFGVDRIGGSIEEFIADGIILMGSYYDNEGLLRRSIRILKMRGTNHALGTYEYIIDKKNGIKIKT